MLTLTPCGPACSTYSVAPEPVKGIEMEHPSVVWHGPYVKVPSNHEALGTRKLPAPAPRAGPALRDSVLLLTPLGVVVTVASELKASQFSPGAVIP